MGFQDQLHSILARLPESRQTLLFSATLPKLLVDFAKAGLHDPTLIRLDVDTKISDQLKVSRISRFCSRDLTLNVAITTSSIFVSIAMHNDNYIVQRTAQNKCS